MHRSPILIAFTITVIVCCTHAPVAFAAEPVGDGSADPSQHPWATAGLGSWVSGEMRETDAEGEETVASGREVLTSRGDEEFGTSTLGDSGSEDYHGPGTTFIGGRLADMNIRQEDTREETLVVDGREIACRVSTWRGGAQHHGARALELELWTGPEVILPQRALQIPGWPIRLEGDVLRAVAKVTNAGESTTHTRELTGFDEVVEVDGRKLSCLRETQHRSGPRSLEGFMLWCPEVPGWAVAQESDVTFESGGRSYTWHLSDFGVEPHFDRAAAERAIEAGERPAIPDSRWGGLHVGAWRLGLDVHESENRRTSLVRERVLGLQAEGYVVEHRQDLGFMRGQHRLRLQGPAYEFEERLPSAPPETFPQRLQGAELTATEAGEVELAGETVACSVGIYRLEESDETHEFRLYLPEDAAARARLAAAGLAFAGYDRSTTSEQSWRPGVETERSRVVAFDQRLPLPGGAVSGALQESVKLTPVQSRPEPNRTVERSLHSAAGPENGWGLVQIADFGERQTYRWSIEVARGEADEAPPEVDGRALLPLAAIGWMPFADHTYRGSEVGSAVVFATTLDDGSEIDLIERVEQVGWMGLPLVNRYRRGMADDPPHPVLISAGNGNTGVSPTSLGLERRAERAESITIDGRELTCRRVQWGGTVSNERWQLVRWHCDEVELPYREASIGSIRLAGPADLVREEILISSGVNQIVLKREIEALAEPVAALEREFSCARERRVLEMMGNTKGRVELTTWLHDDVPGHIVKQIEATSGVGEDGEPFEETFEMLLSAVVEATPATPALREPDLYAGFEPGAWVRYRSGEGENAIQAESRLIALLPSGQGVVREESFERQTAGEVAVALLPVSLERPLTGLVEMDAQPFQVMWDGALQAGIYRQLLPMTGDRMIEYIAAEGVTGVASPLSYGTASYVIPANATQCVLTVQGEAGLVQLTRSCDGTREPLEIDGRELECLRDQVMVAALDQQGQSQPVLRIERWLSDEVPGRVVRTETHQLDQRYGGQSQVLEVVAFGRE